MKNNKLDKLIENPEIRKELVYQSHRYFFATHFSDYLKYPSADFQREMFDLSEDESNELVVITAFRGSGKSTIFSTSFPIWSIIGIQKKRFILLVSKTKEQANLLLRNIKAELENNELLKSDLGPFEEVNDEWRLSSIVIPKYGARIMSISVGQSMRGIRHKNIRPDLIICDDLEDVLSSGTKEGRDKVFGWFSSDLIPSGDFDTRTIVIGNLVHEDSLIMRLRDKIIKKEINGIYKTYPLIDKNGDCLWREKYSSNEIIQRERKKVTSEKFWQREYLLRIVSDEEDIIKKEWIRKYSQLPLDLEPIALSVGIDLAITENTTSDYTAIIPGLIYITDEENYSLYILPSIVHKKMEFPKTISTIEKLNYELKSKYKLDPIFLVEGVAYQRSVPQELKTRNIQAESITPSGSKKDRLYLISPAIYEGKVFFPEEGADELINELVNFGKEKHDDLADALAILVTEVIVRKQGFHQPLFFA